MRRVTFLLLLAMAATVPATVSGAVTDPTVTLDRTGTTSGEEMVVTGAGWPDGATLVVELCGQGGIHGSVDCDVSHQRTAGVGPSGTFSTTLTVAKPPTACPCVVKATDQTSHVAATAAISVAGVATVPIAEDDPDAVRRIEITGARIVGEGAWTEHLGAPSPRVLHLTLVNSGAVAVRRPVLSVAWGRGTDPTGFVPVPDLEAMEPGATQDVTVNLPRGALAFGEYTAVAEVQGLAERMRSSTSTSTYPWGLVGAGLVLVQLLLLRLRNRLRRRFHRGADPDPVPAEVAAPALPPAPLALPPGPTVIDLRDDEVIDLDEVGTERPVDVPALDGGGEEATAAPPSLPPLAFVGVANGHANGNGQAHNGNGNGKVLAAPVSPAADPVVAHVDHTAVLTAELLTAFSAAGAAAQAEADDCARRARASLTRATELSDALVAAAEARAEELTRDAGELERASQERLEASAAVLEAAREQAGRVVAQAQATAQELLTAAAEEHARAEAHRTALERERAELVAAARCRVEEIVQELQVDVDGLAESLQERVVDLLQQASDERRTPPPAPAPVVDELDRRLAQAVTAALSGR